MYLQEAGPFRIALYQVGFTVPQIRPSTLYLQLLSYDSTAVTASIASVARYFSFKSATCTCIVSGRRLAEISNVDENVLVSPSLCPTRTQCRCRPLRSWSSPGPTTFLECSHRSVVCRTLSQTTLAASSTVPAQWVSSLFHIPNRLSRRQSELSLHTPT